MRFALAMLLAFSTLASGCIFGNGFDKGCPVFVIFGNYSIHGLQIVSLGGTTPGILSGADNLFDGQPSTLCTIQWVDGTQSTSSQTGIQFQLSESPDSLTATVVGGVMVKNTSLPAGLKVELHQGTIIGTLLATGTLQNDPAGGTSVVLLFDEIELGSGDHLIVDFYNDVGGTHPINASDPFTVGDVLPGKTASFNADATQIKRTSKQSYAQTPKLRQSSSGVQWPIQQPTIRTMQVDLKTSPMKPIYMMEETVGGTTYDCDIESIIAACQASNVFGFIPWETLDVGYYGPQTIDSDDSYKLRARTAFLGQFLQPPTITATDMYFDTQMVVQESV